MNIDLGCSTVKLHLKTMCHCWFLTGLLKQESASYSLLNVRKLEGDSASLLGH